MKNVLVLPIICALLLTGCAKIRRAIDNVPEPPPRTVAISVFKCNCDPLITESVQDSFVDVFFKSSNARPIKGDDGDIVIKGILTFGEGSTGASKGIILGGGSNGSATIGGGSSGSSASGIYITGITVQAHKNNEIIATYSAGQNLKGGGLVSPVSMAKNAASYISAILIRKYEIGRKSPNLSNKTPPVDSSSN